MAIAKMLFMSITGPEEKFDELVEKNLSGCPVQYENPTDIYGDFGDAVPLNQENPYEKSYNDVAELEKFITSDKKPTLDMDIDEAQKTIDEIIDGVAELDNQKAELLEKLNEQTLIESQLEPLNETNANLEQLFSMKFVEFRFGRLQREYFLKLNRFLKDLDAIYIVTYENNDYVWLMYFSPNKDHKKIDNVFHSLYFERIWISEKAYGKPHEAFEYFCREKAKTEGLIKELDDKKTEYLKTVEDKFLSAKKTITEKYQIRTLRKYALKTERLFVMYCWICKKDFDKIKDRLDKSDELSYQITDDGDISPDKNIEVPVKLENKGVFKAFEWFLNMYALPKYNEFDPTKLMAITYIFIFGIMFGDVGHGLCLAVVGLLLYKLKKTPLGMIMIPLGLMSCVFGFMYGSVFGYEDLIPTLLIKPMENSSTITTMLYSTVGLGGIFILMAMIANIINGIKQKNIGRILFSQNGVAGIVMYGGIMAGILAMLMKKSLFGLWYNLIVIVLPIVVIFLQEPLSALVEGKKIKFSFVDTFFEFFEIMLSFVTNTISFIRIGAFALNHAGMLSVVFVIANMASGAGSVVALVLGNILVIVLEGLVVGIQVLRLEFFELFSRYYTGGGRKFAPTEIN